MIEIENDSLAENAQRERSDGGRQQCQVEPVKGVRQNVLDRLPQALENIVFGTDNMAFGLLQPLQVFGFDQSPQHGSIAAPAPNGLALRHALAESEAFTTGKGFYRFMQYAGKGVAL